MKTLTKIFAFIFILSFIFIGEAQDNQQTKPIKEKVSKETTVYICDSKSAIAYHSSSSCSGINKCKHQVLEVTKKEAVNKYGRRACKVCY